MRVLLLILILKANIAFGQILNLQNIDNLFLEKSKKSKIKIDKKAPITFTSIEKKDSIYIQKTITGFIRSLNDTISCQLLPVNKLTRIYKNNNLIQDYKDFREESFSQLEDINFNEFNKITYQKVRNRRIDVFLNKITIYTLAITVSTIPFIKTKFDDDGFIHKGTASLGISTAFMVYFVSLVFKPYSYYLRPCKDCKKKKQVYHLKVM